LGSQALSMSRPLIIAAPRTTSSKHGRVAVSAQAGSDERSAVGVRLPEGEETLYGRTALRSRGGQDQRGAARRALGIHRSAGAQQRSNQRLRGILARVVKRRASVNRPRVGARAAGQQDLQQVQPVASSGQVQRRLAWKEQQ